MLEMTAKIDWLQGSWHFDFGAGYGGDWSVYLFDNPKLTLDYLREEGLLQEDDGSYVGGWYTKRYKIGSLLVYAGKIVQGVVDMQDMFIWASGQTCSMLAGDDDDSMRLVQLIRRLSGYGQICPISSFKASRIDLALDDGKNIIDLAKMAEKAEKRHYRGQFATTKVVKSNGYTVYFGSGNSDVQFRFYDKAAEQNRVNDKLIERKRELTLEEYWTGNAIDWTKIPRAEDEHAIKMLESDHSWNRYEIQARRRMAEFLCSSVMECENDTDLVNLAHQWFISRLTVLSDTTKDKNRKTIRLNNKHRERWAEWSNWKKFRAGVVPAIDFPQREQNSDLRKTARWLIDKTESTRAVIEWLNENIEPMPMPQKADTRKITKELYDLVIAELLTVYGGVTEAEPAIQEFRKSFYV